MSEAGGSPYAIPRLKLGMTPYIWIPLLGVIIYSLWEDKATQTVVTPVDVPTIEQPESLEVLVARCSRCHGERGGDSSGAEPYIAGQNVDYLVFAMRTYTMGLRKHEAMAEVIQGLSLTDIKRLAVFYNEQEMSWRGEGISTTPLPDVSDGHDPITAGGELAHARCEGCHGDAARAGTPRLNGLSFEYMVAAMVKYQNQERSHAAMGEALAGMSVYDLERVSFYYASQPPLATVAASVATSGVDSARVASCNGCHGDAGNSRKKRVPSLAGQDRDYLLHAMQAYQRGDREDVNGAHTLASLGANRVADLADYYAALPHQPVRVRSFKEPKNLAKACNTCHGYNGHSQNASRPAISGQVEGYLVEVLRSYQRGERDNNAMKKITRTLSQLEILAIADFYANQN